MQEPGWLPTVRGSAVLDYIERRRVVESGAMSKEILVQRRTHQTNEAVEVSAMSDDWWVTLGRLHAALAGVLEHPWSLNVTGWIDGEPSVHIRVRAPNGDVFKYDRAFKAAVAEHMPPGYYDDGTDVDVEVGPDGLRERGYYLYPETRDGQRESPRPISVDR